MRWIGAPCQGPVPVNHARGGDVMQGTRNRALLNARHPAVESTGMTRVSLRRGAVSAYVAGHGGPRNGGVP